MIRRKAWCRALRTMALAGLATLAAAPAAGAATVSQEGDALVLRAAPGERNTVYLGGSWDPEGRVRLHDVTADITALPATCTRRSVDVVDCDVPGRVRVELGDGDDSAAFSESWTFALPVEFSGDDGHDRLDGNHYRDGREVLAGGPGKDLLTGFGGNDELRGGAGDDGLDGMAGDDVVLGEDGNDKLAGDGQAPAGNDVVDGGAGSDQVAEYSESGTSVHPPANVSLDGVPNDGRPGEADNVMSIERYVAYVSGRFVLSDGPETWEVWSNMDSGASEVLAGGGDDIVTGEDAVERIDGGAGNDRLEGGKNHDELIGGPGEDLIYGDETTSSCNEAFPESCVRYGNDVIRARDGQVDGVDCGAGVDRVIADPADVVAQNCEHVERGAPSGDPGVAGPTQPAARKLRLAIRVPKLRAALARGLTVRLAGARPGRVKVVAMHGRRVVGRATARIAGDGTGRVTVRFTRTAARRLRGKRLVILKVSASGRTATVRLKR